MSRRASGLEIPEVRCFSDSRSSALRCDILPRRRASVNRSFASGSSPTVSDKHSSMIVSRRNGLIINRQLQTEFPMVYPLADFYVVVVLVLPTVCVIFSRILGERTGSDDRRVVGPVLRIYDQTPVEDQTRA